MMDCAALRTQAVELLQCEGCVVYRILKLRLQPAKTLDDPANHSASYPIPCSSGGRHQRGIAGQRPINKGIRATQIVRRV